MTQKDIIIIGSGINSLVSAAILKEAGKSILILEARDNIGGLASSIEFVPGFKCNLIHDTIKLKDANKALKKIQNREVIGRLILKP